MPVGEAAALEGMMSAVGIERWNVKPAASLAREREMAPAESAYAVSKTNAWRLRRNEKRCVLSSCLLGIEQQLDR